MQRVTITLDDVLVELFEAFFNKQGYSNRSEAFRDLFRERLARIEPHQRTTGDCYATPTYVYNHHQRDVADRTTKDSHAHHDLTVSTLHVHLDHGNCRETAALRAPIVRFMAFADSVIARLGVHHGGLHMIPIKTSIQTHMYGIDDKPHRHLHREPVLWKRHQLSRPLNERRRIWQSLLALPVAFASQTVVNDSNTSLSRLECCKAMRRDV